MKKTILIDMDEVLIESFTVHLLNLFKGTNYTKDTFTKTYIQDELEKSEIRPYFDFIMSRDNVYKDVPLMEGVKEVLPLLNEKYEVYICTDFLFKGYECESSKLIMDKCVTLKKHFPYIRPEQYIFMRNKTLLKADYIIDDRPSNFGDNAKALLFTRSHNKHLTDKELESGNITRIDSWQDIAKLLLD